MDARVTPFVTTSCAVALAVVLGAVGCHRPHGPQVVREAGGTLAVAPAPSPLEAGRDKGAPALAGDRAPPPAVGPRPRTDDRPIDMPYRHDGARIDRSQTSGAPGTDLGHAGR